MKLEDQKAIIKTKDNLGKKQQKRENERKARLRIKKVRNKNEAN